MRKYPPEEKNVFMAFRLTFDHGCQRGSEKYIISLVFFSGFSVVAFAAV